MGAFTEPELAYLGDQRLGRVATANGEGLPDVAPVAYLLEGDVIVIPGLDLTKTVKYHNVSANPWASFVVDDLASVDPWVPRGLKVRGPAEIGTDAGGSPTIRITPATIWSWGLNEGVEARFHGIERREVAEG